MKREEVLAAIDPHRTELRDLGVRRLLLFGSAARNEARPGSDVDLLVEFDRPIGLFGYVRLQRRIEQWLGCSVDLVPADGLKPALRESVLREAVRAA